MRGLVDHQAAGDFLLAVPAAEIVRAVQRVQQPVKIHGHDVADGAAHEHVLDLRARRRIAVVEQHAHVAVVALAGVDDALRLFGRGGQRLFGDAIAAGVQRAHDVFVVERVGAGDDDAVGLQLLQHLVEVSGEILFRLAAIVFRKIGGDELRSHVEAPRVHVADADEFIAFGEGLGDRR